MIPFSKRRAIIALQCEQIRQRRELMLYHKSAVKHGALAVCRRPSTLVAAFATGGLLAYIFGPASKKSSSATPSCQEGPREKGLVRKATEMALTSYLVRVLEELPGILQQRQTTGSEPGDSPRRPVA